MSKFGAHTPPMGNENSRKSGRTDRRAMLVDLLVAHHLAGNTHKLKYKDVAEQIGISRQALDLYYAEYKPYIAGKKNIAELIDDGILENKLEAQTALSESEAKWKKEIQRLKDEHKREIAAALDSHISSLMNNDILLLESNQIRTLLERQTLHNNELIKKVHELELKLTQSTIASLEPSTHLQTRVIYDLDIEKLCGAYLANPDIDAFEDGKDKQLRTIQQKITKFRDEQNLHIILFSDRYISRFSTFAKQYNSAEPCILLIRLPLFTKDEILSFLRHLPPHAKKSLYIPVCNTDAERKAQRTFIYQQAPLPPEEIKCADRADHALINWGLDRVVYFKIRQGD